MILERTNKTLWYSSRACPEATHQYPWWWAISSRGVVTEINYIGVDWTLDSPSRKLGFLVWRGQQEWNLVDALCPMKGVGCSALNPA